MANFTSNESSSLATTFFKLTFDVWFLKVSLGDYAFALLNPLKFNFGILVIGPGLCALVAFFEELLHLGILEIKVAFYDDSLDLPV